jgi:hypothetical protein
MQRRQARVPVETSRHDASAGGAECHANANLGSAARRRLDRNAVKAESCEQQRQDTHTRGQLSDDAFLRERGTYTAKKRLKVNERFGSTLVIAVITLFDNCIGVLVRDRNSN